METAEESKSNDVRSRVTRQLIWEALFELLSERYFSEISVQNICQKAQVNRSTFYHHFKSKYDLLEYGIATIVPQEMGLSTASRRGKINWGKDGPHAALFVYVKEHQRFWNNILVQEGFSETVFRSMLNGTKAFLKKVYVNTADDETANEIAAQMYIGAVGNLTIWWLKQGCEMPIEDLCGYVDALWRYPKKRPSLT